jgi:hypothetical protein
MPPHMSHALTLAARAGRSFPASRLLRPARVFATQPVPIGMLISGHTCAPVRYLSTTPDPPRSTDPPSDRVADPPTPPKPRRPSPYRLLPPHTFLAHFAPLHVVGWRLDLLPSIVQMSDGNSGNNGDGAELRREVQEGMADLQDRRLVRMWEFGEGKDGWRGLMRFAQTVGQIVEEEDVSDLEAVYI